MFVNVDVDECQLPNACGQNALCQNTPGNYSCLCPEGFHGNPFDGCVDVDECNQLGACGPGATCTNLVGGRQCHCPPGNFSLLLLFISGITTFVII